MRGTAPPRAPEGRRDLFTCVHDAEVREVEALHDELAGSGLRDEVMRYVGCVQSWIRGHMDWAAQTGRYGVLPVACAV